eukprot:scaffold1305_cov248-Pinguiococcus_pyrenoidosus.AAC.6
MQVVRTADGAQIVPQVLRNDKEVVTADEEEVKLVAVVLVHEAPDGAHFLPDVVVLLGPFELHLDRWYAGIRLRAEY